MKIISLLFVLFVSPFVLLAQDASPVASFETGFGVVGYANVEAAILAKLQPKSQVQLVVKVDSIRDSYNPLQYLNNEADGNYKYYTIKFTLNDNHKFTCDFTMRKDVNAIVIDGCDASSGRIHTLIVIEYEEIGLSYHSINGAF